MLTYRIAFNLKIKLEHFAIIDTAANDKGSAKLYLHIHPGELKMYYQSYNTVELQWLEHPWNHENMFEAGDFRARVLIIAPG